MILLPRPQLTASHRLSFLSLPGARHDAYCSAVTTAISAMQKYTRLFSSVPRYTSNKLTANYCKTILGYINDKTRKFYHLDRRNIHFKLSRLTYSFPSVRYLEKSPQAMLTVTMKVQLNSKAPDKFYSLRTLQSTVILHILVSIYSIKVTQSNFPNCSVLLRFSSNTSLLFCVEIDPTKPGIDLDPASFLV